MKLEKIKCVHPIDKIYYILRFIDTEKRIIVKLYLKEYQPQEIASELNISLKTVYKSLNHFLYIIKVVLLNKS